MYSQAGHLRQLRTSHTCWAAIYRVPACGLIGTHMYYKRPPSPVRLIVLLLALLAPPRLACDAPPSPLFPSPLPLPTSLYYRRGLHQASCSKNITRPHPLGGVGASAPDPSSLAAPSAGAIPFTVVVVVVAAHSTQRPVVESPS